MLIDQHIQMAINIKVIVTLIESPYIQKYTVVEEVTESEDRRAMYYL